MSDARLLVDSVEDKVNQLLKIMESLKQENQQLTDELARMNDIKLSLEKEILNWEEKYHSLKLANSMLGSDKNKTEAKLKINALIREIDQCIAQLSE
ncbi:hypothetical protein [Abyssalbus ytuae]|uniref:Uncharacterized protein n=1 Tax=Abyssalbus ytuae TaxID=2926907 RepID=A0A9E7D072_9FLAO|nr:hypothetical protein [Abyssalbus ytuae]UOB18190.1 hypothetical protein MQE35_02565 [Abyssalbus ytuae]